MKERGVRRQCVIASKLGFDYPGCPGGLTAAQIEQECEKSLKRLQTDYVDLYQTHWPDHGTRYEDVLGALDELPELYRAVLVARYLEGRAVQVIARALSRKPDTVSQQLRRGAEMWRQAVGVDPTTFLFTGLPT